MTAKDQSAGPTWAQYIGQTVRPLSCGCTVTTVSDTDTTCGSLKNPWTVQLCPTHAAVRPLPAKDTILADFGSHLDQLAVELDRKLPLMSLSTARATLWTVVEYSRRCRDSVKQATTAPELLFQLLTHLAWLTSSIDVPNWRPAVGMRGLCEAMKP